MRTWKGALFAFLLFLAQTAALLHVFEHLAGDADRPANHGCSFCLAAHGLDAPLASLPAAPAPMFSGVPPFAPFSYLSPAPALPARGARAPPSA